MTGIIACEPNKKKQPDKSKSVDYTVNVEVVKQDWDGEFNWSQARVASIPGMGIGGKPKLILTMQKWFVSKSDFYSGLFTMSSVDMGNTWTEPTEQSALGWRYGKDSVIAGICDITPGWHAPTGKVLALGHTVYYKKGGQLVKNRPRSTAYAVYDPETDHWSSWKELEMPDKFKFYNSGSGCGQWLATDDERLLIPTYFKAINDTTNCYASTVLQCRFDGEKLTYIKHGDELSWKVPRGIYEPSLTFFDDRYFLTLRNDIKAYVSVSDDALSWQPIKPWTFEDGSELGSYNTQQHWAVSGDNLYLVYTRRGADNDHIPRNRAPLFMARVDPEKLHLLKNTEKIMIPERGSMLGNFGVSNVDKNETWVTVGENMYPPENLDQGADGSVLAARIKWSYSK